MTTRYTVTASRGQRDGKGYAVIDNKERRTVSWHRTIPAAMRAAQALNRKDPFIVTPRKFPFDWDNVSVEDRVKIVDTFADDGHTVYDAQALMDDGLVPEYVAREFTRKQTSDGTWKGTTWGHSGEPIEPIAIYGLDVLESLAHYYGFTSGAMGRGFRARDLTRQLRAILKETVS